MKKSVLVVEDETIVQLHLRKIVQDLGYELCGVASSYDEAIRVATEHHPDLALMDIRLQGEKDGIDTARELRSKLDVEIVFVTAYADAETVARTEAVGASGYVVKPFTQPAIRAALATAFSRKSRPVEAATRSLQTILGHSKDVLLVIDSAQKITFANSHATKSLDFTLGAADTLFEDVFYFCSPLDRKRVLGLIEDCLKNKEEKEISPFSLVLPNDSEKTFEGTVKPLQEEDDTLDGVVLSLRPSQDQQKHAAPQVRDFGEGARIMLYSHDTFGLGHFQRCYNISRTLAAEFPNASILLATGSAVAHRFPIPDRADYIKLPTVRKVSKEGYEARFLDLSDEGVLNLRKNLLLRTVQEFQPDVLLVDHSPIGMKGELRPVLEYLRRVGSCKTILGLRDVIDAPATVRANWRRDDIYGVLDRLYEHVIVYGTQDLFDPAMEYDFPSGVRGKTSYVDYVTDIVKDDIFEELFANPPGKPQKVERLVAVTVGGGDGAGELIVGNFLKMLEMYGDRADFSTILLPGPLMAKKELVEYRERAQRAGAELLSFVPSTSPIFRRAELVVSTAGYNTMTQVLSHAKRSLVIPRVMHREEQLIRATRFAKKGWVSMLHPSEVTPDRLFSEITAIMNNPSKPLEELRNSGRFGNGGNQKIVDFFRNLKIAHSEEEGTS